MDEDEPGWKVEYLDTIDGVPEETNWIKRAGRAKVTYPNGATFQGEWSNCRIIISEFIKLIDRYI